MDRTVELACCAVEPQASVAGWRMDVTAEQGARVG
jgi:hypothetical protein